MICKKSYYITRKTKYNQLTRKFMCPNCGK
ncbi:MAG: hypothetical protein AB7U98_05160 [Candidatus Nitrosocosmicus sp.]